MFFQDAKLFHETHEGTRVDCHRLLDRTLPKMSFHEDDTVMDIGCGPGDNTRDIIRARIPKLKKVVGIDIMPQMIEFAKANFADEKIEHHVADTEDRSSLEPWEGLISKAFSVQCLHLPKNQSNAFQNLYNLLKPNGEAALLFALSLRLWDFYPEMINCEKWNRYLKEADLWIPDSHRFQLGTDHYRKLLEDLGFEVLLCEQDHRAIPYSEDNSFKRVMKAILALPHYIPEETREEFVDEFFNCVLTSDGRNSDGQIILHCTNLRVHIRKH